MAIQQEQHAFKGMQRDLSVSKFSPEYYFEAQNIRITAREDNTLLSITNEKGNKQVLTRGISILGTVLGYATLNDYVIIFSTEGDTDHIYRLLYNPNMSGGSFVGVDLLALPDTKIKSLGFKANKPIEAFCIYENEEIQKVYWTDGENQPRMLNFVSKDYKSWNSTSFDFSPEIALRSSLTVKLMEGVSGVFSSGVIQYAFTYINKYGVETPVIDKSSLQYVAFTDRGASPEDKVSCGFYIEINDADINFELVRLYSIHRASLDGTPDVRHIIDLPIIAGTAITYTDTNTVGDTIDATELLYKGGDEIIADTMTNKDQVLFFGNIRTKRPPISKVLKDSIKKLKVDFTTIIDINSDINGFYPYHNSLNKGEKNIKHFKRREWYRIGLQLQYKNGQWSEVAHIKDIQLSEDYLPDEEFKLTKNGDREYFFYPRVFIPGTLSSQFYKEGFRRFRLAVVYPSDTDREVVCQGMLCPTVFNIANRYSGACFAQASWFARPFPAFEKWGTADGKYNKEYEKWVFKKGDTKDNSVAGILTSDYFHSFDGKGDYMSYKGANPTRFGRLAEYRHLYKLPDNRNSNGEIQCNFYDQTDTSIVPNHGIVTDSKPDTLISNSNDIFMVDASIVTLHSPDIEFNDSIKNLESDSLKLRIVGVINLTSSASDLNIQTSTPIFAKNPMEGYGFYKEFSGKAGLSHYGGNIRISNMAWIDAYFGDTNTTDGSGYISDNYNIYGYYVYPWHANRSLINQSQTTTNCGYGDLKYSLLDKKKLSNIRFSAFNSLFKHAYNTYERYDAHKTGISGVRIWNSNEDTIIKLPAPKNSGLAPLVYKGNIDVIITPSLYNKEYISSYYEPVDLWDDPQWGSINNLKYKEHINVKLNKINGYPIVIANSYHQEANYNRMYNEYPTPFIPGVTAKDNWCEGIDKEINSYGSDPVRIKYKSTPHAVIALNYGNTVGKSALNVGLPATAYKASDLQYKYNLPTETNNQPGWFFWSPYLGETDNSANASGTVHPEIDKKEYYSCLNPDVTSDYPLLGYSYLYLGELYRDADDVPNRFGGTTEEAIQENIWYAQPDVYNIYEQNFGTLAYARVGDTFYMRYDCLKTYPFTLEDQNSIVDIVSFKCETRINLDGRYDRNRGQTSNLVMTPENFNKMNPVYDQKDNFWTYRGLNSEEIQLDNFTNGITWTKEKIPGADVDNWTQINLASMYYLAGDKGKVTSLQTFNNEIYAFQEYGLSHILYNARVQIPASDGVPIEISNGAKMGGSIYVSEVIGCQNKWSIVQTPLGLYFVDNNTNALYIFNGQLDNISDRMGFKSWLEHNNNSNTWDPYYWENFKVHYDRNNGDVYFTLKDTSLCYAEPISQFTSFMNYEKVPAMFNIGKDLFSIKQATIIIDGVEVNGAKIWKHFAGEYNMFYDEPKPYSVTFISNSFPTADKIFNTLEFRADSWYDGKLVERTFDTLEVWNEYQRGTSRLTNKPGFPSPLKRKFRIWRANIPRDDKNKRDRIRNTWSYIKLSKNDVTGNRDRIELHDATVHYFA